MRRFLSLLAFLLVIGSTSCFSTSINGTYTNFDAFMQYESAVRIGVMCEGRLVGSGSGFIVGTRKIITAGHMYACPEAVYLIRYRYNNEFKETLAITNTVSETTDAMSLTTWNELPIKATISQEKPLVGETICSIGGGGLEVGWIKKCGYVAYFDEESIISSIQTVPGNSGSPVYDKQGRVVGMIVAGSWGDSREKYGLAITSDTFKNLI